MSSCRCHGRERHSGECHSREEEEKAILEERLKILEKEIEKIKARLAELNAQQK